MPLFSIITISYNEKDRIGKTLESVYQQTCQDYEYILVDGLSTDGTYQIIEIYKEKFSKKCVNYITISEKDSGIYNAMNKGIKLAKGEWLIFLNAGDYFCEENVLKQIKKYLSKGIDIDILCGDFIAEICDLYKYMHVPKSSKQTWLNLLNHPYNHQSTFVRGDLMKKDLYDEGYKIAADYNFLLSSYLKKRIFIKINIPIAVFAIGGISTSNTIKACEETLKIQYLQRAISKKEYIDKRKHLKKYKVWMWFKDSIKKLLPEICLKVLYKRKGYTKNFESIIKGSFNK